MKVLAVFFHETVTQRVQELTFFTFPRVSVSVRLAVADEQKLESEHRVFVVLRRSVVVSLRI